MLKKIKLEREKELANERKAELEEKRAAFLIEQDEVRIALQEAKEQADLDLVDERGQKAEASLREVEEEIATLDTKVEGIDSELSELAEKEEKIEEKADEPKEERHMEKDMAVRASKYETRGEMLARLEREEVRDFYTGLIDLANNKRGITGSDVTIPEIVINMVQQRLGDYSKLYGEVNVQTLGGTGRIILDGAIPEAVWTECCDPVQELASAFSDTEIDCFKVGGFIPICNATLEDSMINLANYIETRLAWAIAKAIDKAIISGTVATKMPTGVLSVIPAGNKVTSDGTLKDIIKNMALIDNGEDGPEMGEVIAVMKRSTYYTHIAPQTLLPTADGRYVVQTASTPYLPDGTRVVFSQYVPADVIVLGAFKTYLLGERAGMNLAVSTDVKFVEDQTVFKGTARYDGKPVYPELFVEITIEASTEG